MRNDLKNTIFLSYRRKDTASATGRLHDYLEKEFGADMVFKDIHDIGLGKDFRKAIGDTLRDCKVVLVLIGDRYVSLTDAEGNIRIMNPNDYVNIEVSTALAFKDQKLVIPILINGAPMPKRDQIPKSMEAITWQNAIRLTNDYWKTEMERLVKAIREYLHLSEEKVIVAPPPKTSNRAKLKEQIGAGKTEKVLDSLLDDLSLEEDIRNQLVMLKSRWSSLKRDQMMGILSDENVRQNNNRINYSLLQILDDLP